MTTKKKIIIGILALLAVIGIGFYLFMPTLEFPTSEEAGIRYKTTPAYKITGDEEWEDISFAKELINIKEKMVVVNYGENQIPMSEWDKLESGLIWKKNLNRNTLFTETAFLGSPNSKMGEIAIREYKGYTWAELAQPMAVDRLPKDKDMQPDEGPLVVKVTKKKQLINFGKEIYQLTDNKGNYYAMHATATGEVNLDVVLPEGWTLRKVTLEEPLITVPFGEGEDAYYNILGDYLGQGYHQYKYASEYYPM